MSRDPSRAPLKADTTYVPKTAPALRGGEPLVGHQEKRKMLAVDRLGSGASELDSL